MRDIKKEYPLLFENNEKEIDKRFKLAWEKVYLISDLLKTEYKAKTVIVFGSLTEKQRFHKKSDIDIAVTGIANDKFYEAYGKIIGKISSIEIDLVDVNDCRDSLLNVINKEGIVIE